LESVTFKNRPSRANLTVDEGDILFAKMQNMSPMGLLVYLTMHRLLKVISLRGKLKQELLLQLILKMMALSHLIM